MTSFIQDVLSQLSEKQYDFSKLTFILPSKRAGTFLKNNISSLHDRPIFSPTIVSIESFVEELSQLHLLSNNELLFEFYEAYLSLDILENKDSFDAFIKWGQILLQDYNEIDRFLVDPDHIFDYLSAIKDIEHWSIESENSELVKNYLDFWRHLKPLYQSFSSQLLKKGMGYQGLLYREAVENLESYIQNNSDNQHIFIGFNALNKSEEFIIQELLQNGLAEIYWDVDSVFMENENHDAGYFLRSHLKSWIYFQQHSFSFIHDHYRNSKNITVTGIAKNIGQVKYAGELIQQLLDENISLDNTAIVLGNENLLIPLLNALPSATKAVNVTMGLSLKSTPLASLFNALFSIHKSGKNNYYYKNVIDLISHPVIYPLLNSESGKNEGINITKHLRENNLIYISTDQLVSMSQEHQPLLKLLFQSWNDQTEKALDCCQKLIYFAKSQLDDSAYSALIQKEYLYRFSEVFNSLKALNDRYQHITNVGILYEIFKELIATETLDFQGEPLKGLQVMGMLETRVLDFDRVILLSVNEGILPAGKMTNSFIPYDVKKENGLPTYKEKDAVYTYHFYHLLQRAKDVHIIYNTEPDTLNTGEKSRFIRQLEIENIHEVHHEVISPKLPQIDSTPFYVPKSASVLSKLQDIGNSGFSPSSLLTYIRDPLQFYIQKILGIKEFNEVEEVVAANTLGTIIHETLKELYQPLIGKKLVKEDINVMKKKLDSEVEKQFLKFYHKAHIRKGKNLIIFEVAKRYLLNFLNDEIKTIEKGHSVKILSIEEDVSTQLHLDQLPHPITLKGQIDRVDEFDGMVRIIDYKSGLVKSNHLELVDWDELTTDYDKYGKSFQVLMYVFILNQKKDISLPVEAGVISFKNLKEGFIKFTKKDRMGRGAIKDTIISEETVSNFQNELNSLILELFDASIHFTETAKT